MCIYTPAKTINELSNFLSRDQFAKKNLKDGPKSSYQVQDNRPDVFGSPFEQAHDWKAYNRFTVARKVRAFSNFQLIVSKPCEVKKFGSLIDYNCQEAMLQPDLAQVTVLINLQCRERTLWCDQGSISSNESECPS